MGWFREDHRAIRRVLRAALAEGQRL